MFTVSAGSTDPAYLVLTVLDRDEYTAGASGATGTLTGNGHTLGLSSIGGDGRGSRDRIHLPGVHRPRITTARTAT